MLDDASPTPDPVAWILTHLRIDWVRAAQLCPPHFDARSHPSPSRVARDMRLQHTLTTVAGTQTSWPEARSKDTRAMHEEPDQST